MYLNARWTTKRENKASRWKWGEGHGEESKMLRWYWEIRKKSEKLGNRDIRRFILMLLVFNPSEREVWGFLVFKNRIFIYWLVWGFLIFLMCVGMLPNCLIFL